MELGTAQQWIVGGFAAGLGLLLGIALIRTIYEIFAYGPLTYLRHAFRMDSETWRLIGILMLLAMVAAMVFTQWA